MSEQRWPRPVPVVGDTTSARSRAADPAGWSLGETVAEALRDVIDARRDIRRYRPDPVPADLLEQVLTAGHHAPSVGHSQPWRFVVVQEQATRDRAAHLADRARLAQAEHLTEDRAARLLDLKLEGLREAPVGVVVACDRRTPSNGVLGRATFPDSDMWSCATAIQNMWLTARALGLGMGWVTLFDPADLAGLLDLPDGVETLGWMCLGWPDERPNSPGLERAAWSQRTPLQDVVIHEKWPASDDAPLAPVSHLRGPNGDRLVGVTDDADELLSPPDSLGVLDRVLNRVQSLSTTAPIGGTLVLVAADHPVAGLAVSAYPPHITRDVAAAAVAGTSMGAAAAQAAGLGCTVVDAGVSGAPLDGARPARPSGERGDLATSDALTATDVASMLDIGRTIGHEVAADGLVVLGEVGVGNTTVAAALACELVGMTPRDAVGLGAGSDAEIVARKTAVVEAALLRARPALDATQGSSDHALVTLRALGGPEIAVLAGVVLGAADAGSPVVLDGLCGSLPGLLAVRLEPSVQAYLVAGQQSRERAHVAVLRDLGLEPLLALRLRAGEGVGACLAAAMLLQGLTIRRLAGRTSEDT